jgi:peptidoglycan/LPS O-acetylase OafA/YrhL
MSSPVNIDTQRNIVIDLPPKTVAHRPEIDGLRSIAVVPVLIVHAGFSWLPGGFLGVDIFFVISGYLIAGILRRDILADNFSLLQFYERRARRILPALFIMLLATAVAAPFLMLSLEFKGFGQSLFAVSLFISNMLFARQDGYFDPLSDYKPLIHTWSLGVEEQFYVLFPILLFILLRQRRMNPVSVLLGLSAVSLIFAEYGLRKFANADFFLLPSRAWELLFGAILALIEIDYSRCHERRPVVFQALSALGSAAILAAYFGLVRNLPSPGVGSSLVVVGTALILTCAAPGTLAHSILTYPLLRTVGLISYSAYLWHQPLFVFARLYWVQISAWQWWALITLAMALAGLSWRYVENPFRDRQRVGGRTIFALAGAGTLLFAVIGLSIQSLNGAPQRFGGPARLIDDGERDRSPLRDTCGNTMPASFGNFCVFGKPDAPIVAVLGDSHGKELFWRAATQLGNRPYALQPFLWNACLPFSSIETESHDGCNDFHRAMYRYIMDNSRIKTIVIAANWPQYFNCIRSCPIPRPEKGSAKRGIVERLRGMSAAMAAEIDHYRAVGKEVVLIYPVPEMPWNVPHYMYSRWLRGLQFRDIGESRAIHDARSDAAVRFLDSQAKKAGIAVVDPADLLCTGNKGTFCRAEQSGRPLYFDGGHLNGFGIDGIAAVLLAHLDVAYPQRASTK